MRLLSFLALGCAALVGVLLFVLSTSLYVLGWVLFR